MLLLSYKHLEKCNFSALQPFLSVKVKLSPIMIIRYSMKHILKSIYLIRNSFNPEFLSFNTVSFSRRTAKKFKSKNEILLEYFIERRSRYNWPAVL